MRIQVRIQLLPAHAHERSFDTCQLNLRHWDMECSDGSIEEVDGSGVVGAYPMLFDGGYRADHQVLRAALCCAHS